jgi:hypothetical protein
VVHRDADYVAAIQPENAARHECAVSAILLHRRRWRERLTPGRPLTLASRPNPWLQRKQVRQPWVTGATHRGCVSLVRQR